MFLTSICLISVLMPGLSGYPFFKENIPNGEHVPHPCTGEIWAGVGHLSPAGGGLRNPFGEAFALSNYAWTRDLCMADSDHDNVTNGMELGDPYCTWLVGETLDFSNVSHPGICEPVDSAACYDLQHFTCEDVPESYDCPAARQPDVQTIDLVFPRTNVPAKETNYFCKVFKVPDDRPYHVVSVEPIIDNINVLHHMLLFGCSVDIPESEIYECGMVDQRCRELIGAWTLGIDGYCLRDEVGVKIGLGAYTSVAVQVHWNNPLTSPDFFDASGLRLFYTSNLREYSEQIAIFGKVIFSIPPMEEETIIDSTCPAKCTEIYPSPVAVTTGLLHMHYLGISGRVDVLRDGIIVRTLIDEGYYSYESPAQIQYDPPVIIRPGDEIRTQCVYNSKDGTRHRTETTYFGQATRDEMCFSFLSYYPTEGSLNSFRCVQAASVNLCNTNMTDPNNCDYCTVYQLAIDINKDLEPSGKCQTECDDDCIEALSILLSGPCSQKALAYLASSGRIPSELEKVTEALLMCTSPSRKSSVPWLQHAPPVSSTLNNIPHPSDCGLVDPPLEGTAAVKDSWSASLLLLLCMAIIL